MSWQAADSTIVRIIGSGSTCSVAGLSPGTTTITATYTWLGESATDTTELLAYRIKAEGLYHPNADAKELPRVNELSLLPVTDRIGHRTIKFEFTPPAAISGMIAQWAFTASGVGPGGAMRGVLATAHNTHLEAEPGFNFDPATLRSTIDTNGAAAVRINMPSIAFNQGRLEVSIIDNPTRVTKVDFEVPAVVVIDPGHGGNVVVGGSSPNNATSTSGVLEKSLALDMSRLVRDGLNASLHNINVVLTRNADVNLGIQARAHVARDNAADVFVCIHYNASNSPGPTGTVTLVRTNGNDQINYAEDRALAARIVNAVLTVNPITNRAHNINDRPDLGVLRDSSLGNTTAFHKTRASYLEVDFITTPAVDVRLVSGPNAAANQQNIASAVRDAIVDDLLNQP